VFGIQVGVGITIAIRRPKPGKTDLQFAEVAEELRRDEKLRWISAKVSVSGVNWSRLEPDTDNNWLTSEHSKEFKLFVPIGDKDAKSSHVENKTSIFTLFSLGIVTSRDSYAYSFQTDRLLKQAETFVDVYNSAVDKLKRAGSKINPETLVDVSDPRIKWTRQVKASLSRLQYSQFDEKYLRLGIYRPYTKQHVYFDDFWNEEQYKQRAIFPSAESEILAICATGAGAERPFATLITRIIPDLNFFGPGTVPQWYPYYVYAEDGTNRRENITDWALEQFRSQYKDQSISKWDIFYYVYGLLHHPGYRTKFADNLKRELPRIPYAPDFRAFQRAGQSLAGLHLDYEKIEPWQLKWIETPGIPLSYRVEKMKLSKDKTTLTVNESLALGVIPADVFEYRLGNRSALDWVIDQYQISTDKRSGIVSDPNHEDDPEYIVRLIGQVVRVSIETVKIVKALPEAFS
jgi:predicted helicase